MANDLYEYTFKCTMDGKVFDHLLNIPVSYFERRSLGDIISRFSSINNIQQTLTQRS